MVLEMTLLATESKSHRLQVALNNHVYRGRDQFTTLVFYNEGNDEIFRGYHGTTIQEKHVDKVLQGLKSEDPLDMAYSQRYLNDEAVELLDLDGRLIATVPVDLNTLG